MTINEAIRILDPETSKEALQPYAYDSHQRHKVVETACRVATTELRKRQWISVEDRLPDAELAKAIEHCDNDLDFYDETCIEVIVVISGATASTVLDYDGNCFYDRNGVPYAVTHWMTLPDPPKE